MYTFYFWKFKDDVISGRTHDDIAAELGVSRSGVSPKLSGKRELKLSEFIIWCNTFNLDPVDYIDVVDSE